MISAYEQLGYLAESATWRNAYLYAAFELRHGTAKVGRGQAVNTATVKSIPTEILFDLLGVQLNGPKADGRHIVTNWNFTDAKTSFVLTLQHSALTYVANKQDAAADASLTLTRDALDGIMLRRVTFPGAVQSGQIKVAGTDGSRSPAAPSTQGDIRSRPSVSGPVATGPDTPHSMR